MIKKYKHSYQQRAIRTRAAVAATNLEHKLTVHKTNKYIYAQVVELDTGRTLCGTWGKSPTEVGKAIAQMAKTAKIKKVVFDRGRNRYHGNVKLLADAAREGGLEF